MAKEENPPHFVLFPFMAQGHMIPMVDIARLLSKRGVIVTILFTPYNHKRFKPVIDRAIASGLSIHISHLKISTLETGLPEGFENIDMTSSFEEWFKFLKATFTLEDQVEQILRGLKPWASCLISDMLYPWTTNVAAKLGIPRLVFHGTSCFSLLCMHMIGVSKGFEDIAASETEYFVLPDFPDRIEITKAQIKFTLTRNAYEWAKLWEQMDDANAQSFGTMANTFEELEPAYLKEYEKAKGKKVWCIGPVSLCNEDELDKAERLSEDRFEERVKERGLLIYGWAPQVLILSHPSVGGFLTHCGWNSTLEGITAGLPLMTWPLFADQFCNEKFIVNVIKVGVRGGAEVPVVVGEEDKAGVQVKSDDIKLAIHMLMEGGEEGEERRERARKLGELAKSAPNEGGSSYHNITRLIQDVVVHKATLLNDDKLDLDE